MIDLFKDLIKDNFRLDDTSGEVAFNPKSQWPSSNTCKSSRA